MKKEVFIQRINSLEKTRQAALSYNDREQKKLRDNYIAENCPIKVGEFVNIGDTSGRIEEIEVDNYGDFYGKWRKCKKNGELYALENRFSSFDFKNMVVLVRAKED